MATFYFTDRRHVRWQLSNKVLVLHT